MWNQRWWTNFLWGPFQLALGLAQMLFALVSVYFLAVSGFSNSTFISASIAGIATLLSRLLFRGRKDPPSPPLG